jgi:hypothetical protein
MVKRRANEALDGPKSFTDPHRSLNTSCNTRAVFGFAWKQEAGCWYLNTCDDHLEERNGKTVQTFQQAPF